MNSHALPRNLLESVDRFAARERLELTAPAHRVLALSDFAQRVLVQQREWFLQAVETGAFDEPLDEAGLVRELAEAVAGAGTNGDAAAIADLKKAFRQLRNRCQLRVVWRHLTGAAPLEETTGILSFMADRFIAAALEAAERREAGRAGEPCGKETGDPQRLAVFGLGKLGGRELNLSSDIDLIFAYPEEGRTASGLNNQQFFTRVGQGLIDLLHPVTVDGFVFRVDMRLRPYGASGPLVMHFGAMQQYFETKGRSWERYALIKARTCAGDIERGEELLASLRPFVFRRYLDFGSLESMRDMKARLAAERHKPHDVKLGPGGIRYAEFAVQVQQLILGGRHAGMQKRGFLETLAELRAGPAFRCGNRARNWAMPTASCATRSTASRRRPTGRRSSCRSPTATGCGWPLPWGSSRTLVFCPPWPGTATTWSAFSTGWSAPRPRVPKAAFGKTRQDRAQLLEAGFDDTGQASSSCWTTWQVRATVPRSARRAATASTPSCRRFCRSPADSRIRTGMSNGSCRS